ncbi:Epsin-3, clathrin recruitment and traffic between the Golgi and endosome [Ascosphaera aggregata]|nr:Epsin-3, clathrin recruitment and traffic between the Golgi and endosome [Ascosphaera aggregata]
MDFQSLRDQVANLSLYDIKAGVRKVQNAVMNFTEMEAKVREATNNEPWGASSTLMQEIANGTHSYQLLNEIMPMIYKRFTEKTAEEWRQIYKALQLLEFLIKNGSERVVDDARSHMSLLKMLRQFHFIDKNGKDQGINVRNRSQELVKLLSDVDQIRAERKKARANRHKFGGFEGGSGFGPGFSSSSSSRFSGFGSDSSTFGGYSGGVFGDGGGFGGSNSTDFGESSVPRRSTRFEEYDEGDDASSSAATASRTHHRAPTSSVSSPAAGAAAREREPERKAPEPVQDLFDFGDDDGAAASATLSAPQPVSSVAAGKKSAATNLTADDEDEFADFQSAPTAAVAAAAAAALPSSSQPLSRTLDRSTSAPQPIPIAQNAPSAGLMGMTSSTSSTAATAGTTTNISSTLPPLNIPSAPAAPQQTSSGYQPRPPNYFTSTTASSKRNSVFSNMSSSSTDKVPQISSLNATMTGGSAPRTPTSISSGIGKSPTTSAGGSGGDVFSSLWSSASASAGIKSNKSSQAQGPKLSSLAKEKATAGIWGAATGGSMHGAGSGGATAVSPVSAQGQVQGHGQGQGQLDGKQQALGNGVDDLLG